MPIIGYNTIGSNNVASASNWNTEAIVGSSYRYTASAGDVVTQWAYYGANTGIVDLGIYTFSGGVPVNLEFSQQVSVGASAAWYTIDVWWPLTAGTTYVVAIDFHVDQSADHYYDSASAGDQSSETNFGPFNQTWSQTGTNAFVSSYYATVTNYDNLCTLSPDTVNGTPSIPSGALRQYDRGASSWTEAGSNITAANAVTALQDDGWTNYEANGDSGVALTAGANASAVLRFDLDGGGTSGAMPADFTSMKNNLWARISTVDFGSYSNDTGYLYCNVFKSDDSTRLAGGTTSSDAQCLKYFVDGSGWAGTAPTASIDNGPGTAPAYNETLVQFGYVDTTATKSDWDGARLEIGWVDTQVKGSDSAAIILVEIELFGEYTAGGTNATATPSVVTSTASVPTPALSTGSTVTATTVTSTASVPTPTVAGSVTVTATVVTSTSSVPTPTVAGSVAVTATVVTSTSSVPTPSVSVGTNANVAATVVTSTASVPTPTVSGSVAVTPTVATSTASVPTPTIGAGVTVATTVVTSTSSVPTPTVAGSVTVTPTVVTSTSSVPTPSVSGSVTVATTVVTSTASVPVPGVSTGGDVAVSATVVTSTSSVPTPSVSTGSTVAATVVTSTSSVPTPTVSGSVAVSATVVTSTASVPTPGVSTGATVATTVVTSTASVPVPGVSAGGGAAVTATVVTSTSSVPTPTVSGSVAVTPTVVTSTSSVPTPTVAGHVALTAGVVTSTAEVLVPLVVAGAVATDIILAATFRERSIAETYREQSHSRRHREQSHGRDFRA